MFTSELDTRARLLPVSSTKYNLVDCFLRAVRQSNYNLQPEAQLQNAKKMPSLDINKAKKCAECCSSYINYTQIKI